MAGLSLSLRWFSGVGDQMVSETAFLDLSEEVIPIVSDHILTHSYWGPEKGGLCQLEECTLNSVFAHVYFVCFVSSHCSIFC